MAVAAPARTLHRTRWVVAACTLLVALYKLAGWGGDLGVRALGAVAAVALVLAVWRLERRAGHSKLSAGIAAEALWRIPALR